MRAPPWPQFDDRHVLALTAWGEARSLGAIGMQATLNSAQNRIKTGVTWWGQTLRHVCLMPKQYSCWNARDPNIGKMLTVKAGDAQMAIALGLADRAIAGTLEDIIDGADSYYDRRAPKPFWAMDRQPVKVIDPHWYYRTIHTDDLPKQGHSPDQSLTS